MRANVTRAAEGFDRRSFTVAEILRMQDAGIIGEDENFELIEGEIVPMQAKTHVHELLKSNLPAAIVRALPKKSVVRRRNDGLPRVPARLLSLISSCFQKGSNSRR